MDAGTNYVQLDSPRYTHMVSEEGQENLRRVGLDTETWLGQMIEMDNALIREFPDVTFAVHLCRGNHRSMWSVEGGYDAIAEQLFNDLACDRILAEYDSPRAGTFEPLRFVPDDKVVVLGLITTKEPDLEDPDLLKRRIEEASRTRSPRSPRPQPPVWVRVDVARQPRHVRRPAGEAGAPGAGRPRRLELTPTVEPSARLRVGDPVLNERALREGERVGGRRAHPHRRPYAAAPPGSPRASRRCAARLGRASGSRLHALGR